MTGRIKRHELDRYVEALSNTIPGGAQLIHKSERRLIGMLSTKLLVLQEQIVAAEIRRELRDRPDAAGLTQYDHAAGAARAMTIEMGFVLAAIWTIVNHQMGESESETRSRKTGEANG